jgi:hypothetical protein
MTEEQLRQLSRWKQCFRCQHLETQEASKTVCKKLQVSISGSSRYEKHGCIYWQEMEAPDGADN